MLLLLLGCQTECTGVGCEEDFDGAVLGVLDGASQELSGTASPLDGVRTIWGSSDLGPDWSVALLPRQLMTGSPTSDSLRTYLTGAVGQTTTENASGVLLGPTSARFGAALARVPDIDGDGVAELAVGAPAWDLTSTSRDEGAVFLLSGLGSGFTGEPALDEVLWRTVEGAAPGGGLGGVLAACADIDGDGLGDWATAAPEADATMPLAGTGALSLSSLWEDTGETRSVQTIPHRWEGGNPGARAGSALACDHDVTGDGRVDLLVGVPFADGDHEAEGAVFVIEPDLDISGQLRLDLGASRILAGLTPEAWLGWSLATGDLNGDGLAEIAAGAPGAGDSAGMVLVWDGAELVGGGEVFPAWRLYGEAAADGFGRSLAIGDIDGDGVDELLVGAPFHQTVSELGETAYRSGSLYLFVGGERFGLPNQSASSADAVYQEVQPYLYTGQQIRLGDIDRDGKMDLALLQRHQPR